jgi:CRISPR-associated protein Cmr1
MKAITFECETITPMFLGGADGRTPELRPPSIKGLMRFWWRAMNAHLSLEYLKEEEVRIFGGSGEKEGRSRIVLRVKSDNEPEKGNNIRNDYNLKRNYNRQENRLDDAGISYLLYSTVLGSGKYYIKDNQKFTVELKSQYLDALKQAVASFWALVYLGGIGTRARRGGGNIAITNIKEDDNLLGETEPDFLLTGRNCDDVAKWIAHNYNKAKSIVNKNKKTRFISEYSNLSISRFIISKNSFKGWKEALNDVGRKFMSFRADNKSDIFGTTAFGLPRKHVRTSNKDANRRSSPLIFKTLKVRDRYYWLVLRLAGEFLPEDTVLKDRFKLQKPSYERLDEFWAILKKTEKERVLSLPDRLNDVRVKIEKEVSPEKMILFGSKARGDFHKKSDIDIAIETDKSIELADIDGAIDIIKLNRIDKSFKEKIEEEGIEL